MQVVGEKRLLQLNKMDEFFHDIYENARIYKESTKIWHDKHISRHEFMVNQKALIYNS